jgi:hypothetical protein
MYEWYDTAESLSSEFNILGIDNIINETKDNRTMNYLVTHRAKACKSEVLRLIVERGCKFDGVFFLGRVQPKAEIVRQLLTDNPNVRQLTIYEDSIWELVKYVSSLEDFKKSGYSIALVFVDKSKVITMPWEAIELLRLHSYEEKIKLS